MSNIEQALKWFIEDIYERLNFLVSTLPIELGFAQSECCFTQNENGDVFMHFEEPTKNLEDCEFTSTGMIEITPYDVAYHFLKVATGHTDDWRENAKPLHASELETLYKIIDNIAQ